MDDVGQIIRDTRERKGLMVKDLAHEVGVVPEYITQVERGYKKPSLRLAWKICNYFQLGELWDEILDEYLGEEKNNG